MPEPKKTQITNCHIHTFTTSHAPKYFPVRSVVVFRAAPWLVTGLRWGASVLRLPETASMLQRLENFHDTSSHRKQSEVFREVRNYYPSDTRFVVLPMDMALIGHGPVDKDIYDQHTELAQLAADPKYKSQVIPFGTIYPDRVDGVEEFKRVVEEHGFRGLKLYNKLGYAPDHPVLMEQIYPYCVKKNIPVMVHCSRGGVYHKGWTQARRDKVTAPDAWLDVLKEFKDLRVCLAHWGGESDWIINRRDGFDPDNPEAKMRNWAARIEELISSGDYPNLWTDISYTMFKFDENVPLLRAYLSNPKVRERVLFGSDFYMTRNEKLSEKEISLRLRHALGEEIFHEIADVNPRIWLGETAE
ncbi:MAG: amidohydrolase family protein [Pseudomonadota bacterium]